MSSSSSHTLRGLVLLLGAIVCFAGMDASAKWLSSDLPPLMVSGGRYLFALLVAMAFLRPWEDRKRVQTSRPGLQIVRGCCLAGTTLCVFTALRYLPLSQVTAINFASPLITALLAGPFLSEKIGPRRLVAVLVGFAGVLVVTRPFGGQLERASFFALAAAISNSFYVLTTRLLSRTDSSEATMFYTSIVGVVVISPFLGLDWKLPSSPGVWAVLVLLGALGAVGHWLLILAHRLAPASTLAPFFYTQIVGSVTLGYLVFREIPDGWTLVGGGIVIASGLYLLYRERVRHKFPSADLI